VCGVGARGREGPGHFPLRASPPHIVCKQPAIVVCLSGKYNQEWARALTLSRRGVGCWGARDLGACSGSAAGPRGWTRPDWVRGAGSKPSNRSSLAATPHSIGALVVVCSIMIVLNCWCWSNSRPVQSVPPIGLGRRHSPHWHKPSQVRRPRARPLWRPHRSLTSHCYSQLMPCASGAVTCRRVG
jgi:hypothetical protein